MANENYVNGFLRKLREQAASSEKQLTPEQLNKKIMNTVAKWWRDETIGYKGFKKGGKSDIEFFAHNHARAGIEKEEGWESMKKAMEGHDIFTDIHKAKYDAEYDRTPFDQNFREGFEKH